jgi:hypothetical protein
MSVTGFLDRFDNTIAGWAYDDALPGQALEIVIESSSREIFRTKADLYRSDLLDAIGECDHGFSFDLAAAIPGYNGTEMSVLACGTDRLVLGQGKWISSQIAVEGKDGWLFLNSDSNDVNAVISGEREIEANRLSECALTFASRSAMLKHLNIPYLAIIMPEKNVVCANLRHASVISDNRPAVLIARIAERFTDALVYPIELYNRGEPCYHRTDTHANAAGYSKLLDVLESRFPYLFKQTARIEPSVNPEFCGDLGNKFTPNRFESTTEYSFPMHLEGFEIEDPVPDILRTGDTLRGTVVRTRFADAPNRSAILFGTSSAYGFLPLISTLFQEIIFIWENTIDYHLIERSRPDLVLSIVSERFLPISCNDNAGLLLPQQV